MFTTTLLGLEEIVAGELRDLGASNIELLNRAVRFHGDRVMLYKSNLHLRTALKVLIALAGWNKQHRHPFLFHQINLYFTNLFRAYKRVFQFFQL